MELRVGQHIKFREEAVLVDSIQVVDRTWVERRENHTSWVDYYIRSKLNNYFPKPTVEPFKPGDTLNIKYTEVHLRPLNQQSIYCPACGFITLYVGMKLTKVSSPDDTKRNESNTSEAADAAA